MYDYLSTHEDGGYYDYCMVSYLLRNTVSENGSVARGVCVTDPDGTLHSVTERTRIETYENGVHFTEDGGASWTDLPGDTPVSMNLWGFGKSFLDEAEQRFAGWLTENLPKNPLKCEYFLPLVVTELIEEGKAKIQVLRSTDKWYGVTYREDKPLVVEAIARKTARASTRKICGPDHLKCPPLGSGRPAQLFCKTKIGNRPQSFPIFLTFNHLFCLGG